MAHYQFILTQITMSVYIDSFNDFSLTLSWLLIDSFIDSFPEGGIKLIQLEGVSETQVHWLDYGKVGTPLVISSLNGPTDMWRPEYWQTDKLIELENMLDIGLH